MNKELEGKVIVNNVPPYAEGKYIVAKSYCGEIWFHNAWDTEDEAWDDAKNIENGFVVKG